MSCFLKTNLLEKQRRGQTASGDGQWGRTVGRRASKEMELSSGARKITPQGSRREDGMRERSGGRKER